MSLSRGGFNRVGALFGFILTAVAVAACRPQKSESPALDSGHSERETEPCAPYDPSRTIDLGSMKEGDTLVIRGNLAGADSVCNLPVQDSASNPRIAFCVSYADTAHGPYEHRITPGQPIQGVVLKNNPGGHLPSSYPDSVCYTEPLVDKSVLPVEIPEQGDHKK